MKKSLQTSKKIKLIRFVMILSIIFILLFLGLGASYNRYKRTASDVVLAGNLEESISLMSDKSAINLALQHERKIKEAEEERIKRLEEERLKEEKAKKAEMAGEKIADDRADKGQAAVDHKANDNKDNKLEQNIDNSGVKRAYLTFDDGPSAQVTPRVLDVLKEYNIKATFFVVGHAAEKNPDILRRIYEEGHAIGNHTYSHRYEYVYRNISNLLKEIEITDRLLKNVLGEDFETKLFRFPGGSFGEERAPFREAVVERGYTYYDWNSLNGDSEGHYIPKDRLFQRFKSTFRGQKELIVLMHDTDAKYTTVESLPYIIEYLQEKGYEFHMLE